MIVNCCKTYWVCIDEKDDLNTIEKDELMQCALHFTDTAAETDADTADGGSVDHVW